MYAVMFRMKESMGWTYATRQVILEKKEIEKEGYLPKLYLNLTEEDAKWVYKNLIFERSTYMATIRLVQMSSYSPTVEYQVLRSQDFK